MSKISVVVALILALIAKQSVGEIYLLDNNFGYGLYPSDWFGFGSQPVMRFHQLRLRPFDFIGMDFDSEKHVQVSKDGFEASLNMQDFKPEEITVKTIGNTIYIEAKHEDQEDNQKAITKQIVRTYTLPEEYDPNQVVSTLSSDGVLTIKAPAPVETEVRPVERVVEVQQIKSAANEAQKDTPASDPTNKLIEKLRSKQN